MNSFDLGFKAMSALIKGASAAKRGAVSAASLAKQGAENTAQAASSFVAGAKAAAQQQRSKS
jgi:hypothetical protein